MPVEKIQPELKKFSPEGLPVPIPKPAETQSGGGEIHFSPESMMPKIEKMEPQPTSAPGGGGAAQMGPSSLSQGVLEKIKSLFTR